MSNLKLFAWGANNYGQLANGQPCEQLEWPFSIKGQNLAQNLAKPEISVVLGGGHSLLLDVSSDGKLYAAGWNNKGQCGDKTTQDLCEFKQIQSGFTDVSAGWDFSLAINEQGVAFGCGSNSFGQLGLGKQVKNVSEFTPLNITEKVKKVSAGMRHSLFLLEDGTLRVCGSGKKGQLCDNEKANQETPKHVKFEKKVIDVKTGQNFSVIIFEDGSFKAYGDDKYEQVTKINQFLDYSQVKQIELGWTHVIILLKNGQLKAFGRNDYGQISCTVGENISFSQISSGYEHCLALSDKQDLYSWGWNEHGNCGLGHTENVFSPKKVLEGNVIKCFAGSGHSFALARM